MKIQILDKEGKKMKESETLLFEEPIREDIIYKVVEAEKIKHPSSPKFEAGMARSASGNISRRRHRWKSDRGRGLSRIPRKVFWRRGTQFSWEGAIVPGTKGGRRAHPPKGSVNLKNINKKELKKALLSALTYVSSIDEVKKKYVSIKDKEIKLNLPIVVEDKIIVLKTKDFLQSLKKILGEFYEIGIQKKTQRAGKGKSRGRKYKRSAGVLVIVGKDEKKRVKGVEVVRVPELTVSDLASNGARLTLFSESAVKELEKVKQGKTKEETKEKTEDKKKKKPKKNKVKKKKQTQKKTEGVKQDA